MLAVETVGAVVAGLQAVFAVAAVVGALAAGVVPVAVVAVGLAARRPAAPSALVLVAARFAEFDFVTQTAPPAQPAELPGPDPCGRKAAMTPAVQLAAQADVAESAALASACFSAENSGHRMPRESAEKATSSRTDYPPGLPPESLM